MLAALIYRSRFFVYHALTTCVFFVIDRTSVSDRNFVVTPLLIDLTYFFVVPDVKW